MPGPQSQRRTAAIVDPDDSDPSSPCSPRGADEQSGLKAPVLEAGRAVLKELRSEYHQINEMEARIQSQRVKWMQQVETWLDQQEQLVVPPPMPAGAVMPSAPAEQTNGNGNHTENTPPSAASDPLALTTFHDSGDRRPGPRPCPPPHLPELEDNAAFEPEFPKASVLQSWQWEDGNNGGNGDHRDTKPADASRVSSLARLARVSVATMRQSRRPDDEVAATLSAVETGRRLSEAADRYSTPAAKRFRSSISKKDRHTVAMTNQPHGFKGRLASIIRHPAFDSTCAFMIIFNSAIIGFETQWMTSNDQNLEFTEVASQICTMFFILELVLRMLLQGRHFFAKENRGWNIFDFVLVVISIVDFFLETLIKAGTGPWGQGLKTIKMLRIVRVFRVFRFFRELSLLALMIVDSLYSLTWALILLMIIIYVFSICFATLATDHVKGEATPVVSSEVYKHFGTLPKCFYTLVLSMLSGVSWGIFSDTLSEINIFAMGLFLFYAAFTILAVMNIITGVFVDNAVETARTQRDFLIQKEMELKEKYASEMRALFCEMDKDGSGTISFSEIQQYLQDARVQGYFAALGLDPNDTERLFRLIDDDGSGDVDVGEFLDGCIRLKGQARSIDVYAIMRHIHDLDKKLDSVLQLTYVDPDPGKLAKPVGEQFV